MGVIFALFLSLLYSIIIVYVLYLIKKYTDKKYFNKYLHNIPGPKPHVFFGNAMEFVPGHKGVVLGLYKLVKMLLTPLSTRSTKAGQSQKVQKTVRTVILKRLTQYTQTYGPIVKVHDGPFSMALVITDPKFMEYILSSTKIISKAFQYDFFHEWLGTGLLTSTGIKWRKRRKMLTPSFHFSILENFMDVFEKVGDIFIERLWEEVGKPSVDIYPLVSLCTLDIICEASMGISINAINDGDSEYVRSVKQMCQIPVDRTFDFTAPFQPWIHPITPNYFKQKRAIKVLHEHTDRVIDERIKNPINISDEDKDSVGMKKRLAFLDLLLTATIDGKPLSRMDIREEVDTFMFEGHDTTSAAIAFAMFSLAENRGIQQKVLEEQISIFGEKKNRKTTTTDLQDMKYLELVIKETLRLYPSVPWVGRKFPEDIEWEGTLYPKDMNLMLYIFGTQRDARYFPEPLKFRPERFLDTEIPNPFAYVPFSAGPRNCIGQRFAMMEMKSTISKIVRNFELLPATPKHELQLAPEVILVSKNGIRISLNRRK